jgi:hypothetical protein
VPDFLSAWAHRWELVLIVCGSLVGGLYLPDARHMAESCAGDRPIIRCLRTPLIMASGWTGSGDREVVGCGERI